MLIIADSGGTKTEWRLISSEGKIEQLITAGLNPNYTSQEEILKILKRDFSKPIPSTVQEIHFYGAGCSSKNNVDKIVYGLAQFFRLKERHIHVNHDLMGAARATAKNKAGIVCILGTGSNACFYDGQNIKEQMVSLGYVLGDEGSGNFIGKRILKDYLEGSLPAETMELFKIRFPDVTLNSVIDKVYSGEAVAKYLASFYTFVHENQVQKYCLDLLISSFEAFLEKSVFKFQGHKDVPVHFIGGVAFSANAILRRLLQKHNLKEGLFIQSPIAGLTLYHQK